jgi:hypothetical protein
MYPQVTQFETRRRQFDRELQLSRERRQAPARSRGGARRRRGAAALGPAIVAFLTGGRSHGHTPVREDALPR